MDARVRSIIQEYKNSLFEPGKYWPEYEFKKRSYERWAVDEVWNYIQKNPTKSPINSVKEFVHMTEEYSGYDNLNKACTFAFQIAHDVGADILDILLAMK